MADDQEQKPLTSEDAFSGLREELQKDVNNVDRAYELLRRLNVEKKQNGLTLVAAHVQGDRGQMTEFFKAHPELPQLKEEDLDVLAKRYKKDLIQSIYFNFINIAKGEDVEMEKMQELMADEKEVLQNFQKLSKVKLKKDIFDILREYLKAKREAERSEDSQITQMFLFFDVGNDSLERLLVGLDKLSAKINKDIIQDLLQRREIEIGLDKIVDLGEDVFNDGQKYSQVNDQIHNILDEQRYEQVKKSVGLLAEKENSKFINLTLQEFDDFIKREEADLEEREKKVKEISSKEEKNKEKMEIAELKAQLVGPAGLRDLVNNLLEVIKCEIKYLEKNSDRYEDMEETQKVKIKKQLELLDEEITARPVKTLDLTALSFLGELVEKRVKHNQEVTDIYNDLSNRFQAEYL